MEDECAAPVLPDDDEVLDSNPLLFASFQSQRSKVLKIHTPQGRDSHSASLFMTAQGQPRSLWKLDGDESFVWAIFDQHEHAVNALHRLPPHLVQPALDSDIRPSPKLRNVDMNAWVNRATRVSSSSFLLDSRPVMRSTATMRHLSSIEGHFNPSTARNGNEEDNDESATDSPSWTTNSSLATPPSMMDTPIPAPSRPSANPRKSPAVPTPTDENEDSLTPIPATSAPTVISAFHYDIRNPDPTLRNDGNSLNAGHGGGLPKNGAARLPSPTDGKNDDDYTPNSALEIQTRRFSSMTMSSNEAPNEYPASNGACSLDEECGIASKEPMIHSNSNDKNRSTSSFPNAKGPTSFSSPSSPPSSFPQTSAGVIRYRSRSAVDQEPERSRFSDKEADPDTSNLGFMLNNSTRRSSGGATAVAQGIMKGHGQNPASYTSYNSSAALFMYSSSSSSLSPSLSLSFQSGDPSSRSSSIKGASPTKLSLSGITGTPSPLSKVLVDSGFHRSPSTNDSPPNSHSFPLISPQQVQMFNAEQRSQEFVNQYFLPTPLTSSTLPALPTNRLFTSSNSNNSVPSVPPTTFRPGDWLCLLPNCGAHNFGRNIICIICGTAKGSAMFGPTNTNASNSNGGNVFGNKRGRPVSPGAIGGDNFGAAQSFNLDPSLSLMGNPPSFSAAAMSIGSEIGTAGSGSGTGGNGSMAMGMGMGTGLTTMNMSAFDDLGTGLIDTAVGVPSTTPFSKGSNAVSGLRHSSTSATTNPNSEMARSNPEFMNRPSLPSSTHIPVIPRLAGLNGIGGSLSTSGNGSVGGNGTGLSRMNTESIQALGGLREVTAIQEAIKAHQTQKEHPRFEKRRHSGVGQQRSGNTNFNISNAFPPIGPTGQLLIPTTLGNSPLTPLPHGPLVVNSNGTPRRSLSGQQNGGRPSAVQSPVTSNFGSSSSSSAALSNLNGFGNTSMFQQSQQSISVNGMNNFSMHGASISHPPFNSSHSHHHGNSNSSNNNNNASSNQSIKVPSLLTPSGRTFAIGGRVQNISRDELNPIFMFWPDNEPHPSVTQIRPPTAVLLALGGVQGPPPPILNTGNKGPIDAQPGDWTCGKCDYLNWRRRRVCANCYPHAEGNTEGTKHSTSDVQERVALLASVLLQQQQQIQAQQQQRHIVPQPNGPEFLVHTSGLNTIRQEINGGVVPAFNNNNGMGEFAAVSGMNRFGHQKVDPLQVLASKYGYAIPPPSVNGVPSSMQQHHSLVNPLHPQISPNHPLNGGFNPNLPPRLAHGAGSGTYGDIGSGSSYLDMLNYDAPPFIPLQNGAGGVGVNHGGGEVDVFNGYGRQPTSGVDRASPPSSRSSLSLGHCSAGSSSYPHSGGQKSSADEPTPSPLPLLPAFLQEVVGDASESSSSRSSLHESPSPPSTASTSSSAYLNTRYQGGGGRDLVTQSERNTSASQFQQHPNNNGMNRNASQSSIWSLGFDYGDIEDHDYGRV